MLDLVAEYWNDVVTVASILLAGTTARYQIRHYRDQRPDLNILELMGCRFYANDYGETVYETNLRVENAGAKSTTITGATLTLQGTGEELRLERSSEFVGMPSTGDGINPAVGSSPSGEFRIPGKDVKRIGYRAVGEQQDFDRSVEATLRIRTAGGGECKQDITFEIVE